MSVSRPNASNFATILFRVIGVILLIVAIIHFAVTSMLVHMLIDGHVAPAAARLVRVSFLLNHLVVGILLIPVALSTIFAAPGITRGDLLARRIGWSNALTVLSLPPVIVCVMGRAEILSGGPFTLAVALVTLAALSLIAGMWLTRRT